MLSKEQCLTRKAYKILIADLPKNELEKALEQVRQVTKPTKKNDKKNDKSRHRTMQSTGSIGRFAGYLTYKAQRVGKKVIRISERDTTKRCSYCMNKENRKLSERTISCDCGLVIKRDTNSSSIQMERFLALLILSQKRLVVRQRLLKDIRVFREKFFSDSQPNVKRKFLQNDSGVGRTRRKSKVNTNSLRVR